ncbi:MULTISPECIES: hypothetical protein [Streptacidiphilus]|uniref:Uncharacterized protein n=1 Tax=Streptacidiphilus cavernicola TaxID=3342716 RepID=A0ABV6UM63_9ACTN|nr:hypothetical protein [Streptacidiphilus jeojiense]
MSTAPRTMPLPERPSPQQLKKRAKDLQRAVRAQSPTALALVARHAPGRAEDPAGFTLDAAQLVIARLYGFPSWPRLREHLAAHPEPSADRPRSGMRTVEDFFRLRTGWADASDLRRCAAAATPAHPDPAQWQPLLTVHRNGVKVIALDSPAGVLFAELTPKRITLSLAVSDVPSGKAVAVCFRSAFGTIAGVVGPDVTGLMVEPVADRRPLGWALVAGGVFVAPNAFQVGPAGLVLRTNGSARGEVVPLTALPPLSAAVVDRPAPAVEAVPAAGTDSVPDLTTVLAAADAPPIVDPEQWRPGVRADLTPTEQLRLARYGRLLVWQRTGGPEEDAEDPFVFDFTPQPGPVRDFAVVGRSISFTRMYYGFHDGAGGTVAVLGLVDDAEVASVTLRRDGMPDLAARIAGRTFLVAGVDLDQLPERGPVTAVLVARDRAGHVCEELPYQEQDFSRRT